MNVIPTVMHHIWIGPDPLPAAYLEFRHAWARLHPDWLHMTWSNDNTPIPSMRNRQLWDEAPAIVPGSVEQFRSDLLRYELLYRYGGVYVDADMEPRRALDPLIKDVGAWAAWEAEGVWVNNAIMAAPPYHPFMGDLIRGLPARVERSRGRGWRPNRISGPHYVTEVYRQNRSGFTVRPKELFYPYLFNELHRAGEEFPAAYAVHHWHNRRKREGVLL